MLETDRTTTLDPPARLAVLLATTGLTQLDLAKLLGVASRTVRRWMQGVCTPPAVAIKELEALARTLDEAADSVVRGMGEQGSAAAVLIVYRRDYDVPPSRGLRTVRCHLALVRRVAERRPDVQYTTDSLKRSTRLKKVGAYGIPSQRIQTGRPRDFRTG